MKLLVDFLLISGFIFSLIVIFLTKKSSQKKVTKNILISIYVLAIIYIVAFYIELHAKDTILFEVVGLLTSGIILLMGPLLLFYIESIFTTKNKLTRKNYYHFLAYPSYWVLIIGTTLTYYLIYGETDTWEDFIDKTFLFYWVETLIFVGYIVFSINRFYDFKKILINNFSSIDEKRLSWTRCLLLGMLIVMSIDILTTIIEMLVVIEWETGYLTIISYIFLLIYLAYYGTYKSYTLISEQLLNPEKEIVIKKENIVKDDLPNDEFIQIEQKFNEVIIKNTPFLNPELNLNILAEQVGITNKKLSSFLNQHLNTTFYDFINSKRIDAVKEKLLTEDLQQYSIMGIAFDCGFKSKSSFNRIFKKETGVSPTQYIESHKNIAVL